VEGGTRIKVSSRNGSMVSTTTAHSTQRTAHSAQHNTAHTVQYSTTAHSTQHNTAHTVQYSTTAHSRAIHVQIYTHLKENEVVGGRYAVEALSHVRHKDRDTLLVDAVEAVDLRTLVLFPYLGTCVDHL
jgi:hypothetical protein